MQRSRHLIQAIIGSVGGRAASLLGPLLVMPAMLQHLGPRDFGVWMTAIAITNIAQFSDLGIGNGLLTRLSAAFAHEDDEAARSDISNGYAVLLIVAVPLVLAGIALMVYPGPGSWPIYGATLIAFALSIPASVIQRVLYASQQVVQANVWQIAAAMVAVCVAFGGIAMDFPPAAVVLTYAAVAPAMMVVTAVAVFARRRSITPRAADVSLAGTRSLLGLGSHFLLLAILTATAMSADNILIALRFGEAAVTDYAVPARIGSLLTLVVATIMMPLWSTYGDAMARGEVDWVRGNAIRMSAVAVGAVALVGGLLTLFIDPLLLLWMGRRFADAHWIVGGMAVFSAATALTSPFNMILNAAGRVIPQIICWSIFLLAVVGAKWLLLPVTGIWILPLVDATLYALVLAPPMIVIGRQMTMSRIS